jgi:hypothetical protein
VAALAGSAIERGFQPRPRAALDDGARRRIVIVGDAAMRAMRRTVALAMFAGCVLVGAAPLAMAQQLDLRPPALSATACPPQQRAACGKLGERAQPTNLQCNLCSPPGSVQLPTRDECALRQMPLGPTLPGCMLVLPLDQLPPL